MKRILITCGTRPDVIKLAPVYCELQRILSSSELLLVATGQHRELAQQVLDDLHLTPDVDLAVMRHGQSLNELIATIVTKMDATLTRLTPTLVLVHGDTATACATALACFYRGVPVAHVEAGLRSFSLDSPFPEELHRRVIATVASLHFAPSDIEKQNLMREGVDPRRIHVTGNTIVDAVAQALVHLPPKQTNPDRRTLLLTVHRRERSNVRMSELLTTLRRYVDQHAEVDLVCPMHLQPAVREELIAAFAGQPRVKLSPPLRHREFLQLLDSSSVVITDSGGVQEEAAYLHKPVVLLRHRTERHDGFATGMTRYAHERPDGLPALLDELLQASAVVTPMQPLQQTSPARLIAQLITESHAA